MIDFCCLANMVSVLQSYEGKWVGSELFLPMALSLLLLLLLYWLRPSPSPDMRFGGGNTNSGAVEANLVNKQAKVALILVQVKNMKNRAGTLCKPACAFIIVRCESGAKNCAMLFVGANPIRKLWILIVNLQGQNNSYIFIHTWPYCLYIIAS